VEINSQEAEESIRKYKQKMFADHMTEFCVIKLCQLLQRLKRLKDDIDHGDGDKDENLRTLKMLKEK
jgi:hypothetical protein